MRSNRQRLGIAVVIVPEKGGCRLEGMSLLLSIYGMMVSVRCFVVFLKFCFQTERNSADSLRLSFLLWLATCQEGNSNVVLFVVLCRYVFGKYFRMK